MSLIRVRFRLGPTTEWESVDPVLGAGEPGFDTTTGAVKIGDGTKHWTELAYQTVDQEALNDLLAEVQAAAAAAEAAQAAAEAAAGSAEGATDVGTAALVADSGSDTRAALDALYALIAHTHTAAQVTDFNTAVRGLLASSLLAGSNVTITDNGNGTFTIASTATGGGTLDTESMMDFLGRFTNAAKGLFGTGLVTVTYDDANDKITIATTATQNQTDAFLLARSNHTGKVTLRTMASDWMVAGDPPATPVGTATQPVVPNWDGNSWEDQVLDLTRYMTKDTAGGGLNGSIRQAVDVDDAALVNGNMYRVLDGALAQIDPEALFALKDPSTGLLLQEQMPPFQPPIQVLQPGDSPQVLSVPSIILRRQAAPSMVPLPLVVGHNNSPGGFVSSLVLTVPEALAVGDTFGIALFNSMEATTVFDHFTLAWSAGAATVSLGSPVVSATTVRVIQGWGIVTTLIPAGSTLTLVPKDSGGTNAPRVHIIGALYRLPNIDPTAPRDQIAVGSGNDTTNLAAISTPAFAADTASDSEVVIGIAGWNSGLSPIGRTIAGTGGWFDLFQEESDNAGSARSLWVGYQTLDAVGRLALTTQMTVSGTTSTGGWAAQETSYAAA